MKLAELFENRDKALGIRSQKKFRAKRMNPKPEAKTQKMSQYSTRPHDPSSGIGGEDQGTGLYS